ncbi:MAG: hypothetical protein C0467_17710 [Planctomycetaceae bacterium]|nr:hypothetical protein [Planctomycetaceae bacterium]
MSRHLFALLIALPSLLITAPVVNAAESPTWNWYEVKDGKVQIHLHVFWSRTCPHCIKAHAFLSGLQTRHDWLKVFTYETSGNPANMDLYRQMAASIGRQAGQVPAFFYCKQLDMGFVSDDTTGSRLERMLIYYRDAIQKQVDDRRPKTPPVTATPLFLVTPPEAPLDFDLEIPPPPPEAQTVEVPWWGQVKADEVSLPSLTLVLGGLDSFNPCAFFVLMILLGLMLHTGSKWKMLLVGSVFVFVSGLVYFLFMAAWLNLFFLIGHLRVITLAAGIVAVLAAIINIKDYFWFKQGVTLSISDSARSRLIGKITALKSRSGFLPIVVGTAGLAFAANLYELLCTSGFPLVYTRVLTLRELPPAEYYGYLALYNVVYVTPLFLIVVGFSLTLSSHKLTEYQGRVLKLISGLMMLALGVILVLDPGFLNNLLGAAVTLAASVGGAAIIVLVHQKVLRHRKSASADPTMHSLGE